MLIGDTGALDVGRCQEREFPFNLGSKLQLAYSASQREISNRLNHRMSQLKS